MNPDPATRAREIVDQWQTRARLMRLPVREDLIAAIAAALAEQDAKLALADREREQWARHHKHAAAALAGARRDNARLWTLLSNVSKYGAPFGTQTWSEAHEAVEAAEAGEGEGR